MGRLQRQRAAVLLWLDSIKLHHILGLPSVARGLTVSWTVSVVFFRCDIFLTITGCCTISFIYQWTCEEWLWSWRTLSQFNWELINQRMWRSLWALIVQEDPDTELPRHLSADVLRQHFARDAFGTQTLPLPPSIPPPPTGESYKRAIATCPLLLQAAAVRRTAISSAVSGRDGEMEKIKVT